MLGDVCIIPPLALPVTLAEAKQHLRMDWLDDTDDAAEVALILDQVRAATLEGERIARRVFVAQTRRRTLDNFPGHYGEFLLPPPLLSVELITYRDGSATTVLDTELYEVFAESEPGRIAPVSGTCWPSIRSRPQAVQVTYKAGHAVTTIADTITAGEDTVTPASMVGVVVGSVLAIDTGANREQVVVTAATSTTFTATFAKNHAANCAVNGVPEDIRRGILLLTGHFYEHREEVITGTIVAQMPIAATRLLKGNDHGWMG